jgi:hypothetical protein
MCYNTYSPEVTLLLQPLLPEALRFWIIQWRVINHLAFGVLLLNLLLGLQVRSSG